jgi:hypothetical protein
MTDHLTVSSNIDTEPSDIGLYREFDAASINAIVNDPGVRPWVAVPGQAELDLTDVLADRRNVLLMIGGGGVLFHQQEPGLYEAHTQFLPQVRGRNALAATRAALHWMFTRTDCMEVLTKVPAHNVAADAWARLAGGVLAFERPDAWQTESGLVAVRYYALHYNDWAKNAPGLIDRGKWFHDLLESEKRRLGSVAPVHSDDIAHDRHVGSAVEMIFGGQPAKGIILYNRWARFAGYALIGATSYDPLTIDIAECLIRVGADTFEVLPCQ